MIIRDGMRLFLITSTILLIAFNAIASEPIKSKSGSNSDSFRKHFELGKSYGEKGRHKDAAREYKRAAMIRPKDFQANYNLCWNLLKLESFREAANYCKNASRIKDDDPKVYNLLGAAYEGMKKNRWALKEYERSVKLKPEFTNARMNLARIYDLMGRLEEAIYEYKQAVKFAPRNGEAYFFMGVDYSRLERWRDAKEAFRRSISLGGKSAIAYYNLGLSYMMLREYEMAEDALKDSLKLDPSYTDAIANLGLVYLRLGNKRMAMKQYHELDGLDKSKAAELFQIMMRYK